MRCLVQQILPLLLKTFKRSRSVLKKITLRPNVSETFSLRIGLPSTRIRWIRLMKTFLYKYIYIYIYVHLYWSILVKTWYGLVSVSEVWESVFLATDLVGHDNLHSLLDNNPLECDCGITPSLWTAEVTGTCAHPPHLRGVEVNTLYIEDFTCS